MLNTLSTAIQDTLNLIVKAFHLSAIFPAFCFVLAHIILLLSQLYDQSLLALLKSSEFKVPGSIVFSAFILTALLSYILNFLNLTLMFFAEGYPLYNTALGKFMTKWQKEFMLGLKESNYSGIPVVVEKSAITTDSGFSSSCGSEFRRKRCVVKFQLLYAVFPASRIHTCSDYMG